MKKLLSDLWNDNFQLSGEGTRRSARERELTDWLGKYFEHLKSVLPESDREAIEKHEDCFWDLLDFTNEKNFIMGFRLGVRLMIEALSEE